MAGKSRKAEEVMRGRSSDTIAYGIAMVIDRGIGLITLPLLTENLSLEEYGVWSQILVFFGFASVVLLLGFYHTISYLVSSIKTGQRAVLYRGIIGIFSFCSILLFIVGIIYPEYLSQILFADDRHASVVVWLTGFVISETLYELIVLGFVRAEDRIVIASGLHIFKSVGRILIFWFAVGLDDPIQVILVGNMVANAGICSFTYLKYIRGVYKGVSKPLSTKFWKSSLRYSLSTMLTVFVGWVSLSGNRFVLLYTQGITENALFAAHYAFSSILTLVPLVLQFTLLHHMSAGYAKGKIENVRNTLSVTLHVYMLVTLPCAIALVFGYMSFSSLVIAESFSVPIVFPFGLILFFSFFGLEQIFVFSAISTKSGRIWLARLIGAAGQIILGVLLVGKYGLVVLPYVIAGSSLFICFWVYRSLSQRIGHINILHLLSHFILPSTVMIVGLSINRHLFIDVSFASDLFSSFLFGILFFAIEWFRPSGRTRSIIQGAV